MMHAKQMVGRWGENVAAEYLKNRGYTIVARNRRTPYGELDLIASKGAELVFVEVKTRTNNAFGLPEEAINPAKAQHLLDSAQHFLLEYSPQEIDWRVDVIAIQGRPNGTDTQIEWFQNVLS
ncbi:MAG TPA: YraN family protein [Anaerolineaceae bacterium]